MSAGTSIKLNYEQSKQEVKELKDIASKLKVVADEQLKVKFKKLHAEFWEGQASDNYYAKAMTLVRSIENTSTKIVKLANAMDDIAEAIKKADNKNITMIGF
ncbi:MAG: WXG100 family type VII secretion target [Lachnospiraceae bacterium]|nr:WXG100 family type VII secretion target [Lachnospiraceae bacterium]